MINNKKYKQLLKQVLERDGFACRRCWAYTEEYPHHIKPKSRFPELIMDPENLVTLCTDCHRWVHDHPKEAHEQGLFYISKYD